MFRLWKRSVADGVSDRFSSLPRGPRRTRPAYRRSLRLEVLEDRRVLSTIVTVTDASGVYGGTTALIATLTVDDVPQAGQGLTFALAGHSVGAATTNPQGVAAIPLASLAGLDAGSVTINVFATTSPDVAGTGQLTISPAQLKITANSVAKTYGDSDPALTVSYHGLVNGDDASDLDGLLVLTTDEPAEGHAPVGVYAITPSGLSSSNYDIAFVSGKLTVNRKALTITAANKSKAYGAAIPPLTAGYSGFASGETADSLTTKPTLTTTATAASPVGTYPITAAGAFSPNYRMIYVAGTLTVTQATPVVRIISSANPAVYAQPVVLTAWVVAPPGGLPTGLVRFYSGATLLGVRKLDTVGRATLAISNWAVTRRQVYAAYGGDENRAAASSIAMLQTIKNAAYEPDPLEPGQQALYIGGTMLADRISVTQNARTERLTVRFDCPTLRTTMGFSSEVSRIMVYGGPGNDRIQIDGTVTVPVWLFGSEGNDTLLAAGGPSLLVGGAGADSLTGGNGRSILIGGIGADSLRAGRGDAILIAGATDHDATDQALAAIMADWASAADYAARVSSLGSRLNALTVHNDTAADTLQGGPGLRWFFADLGAATPRDKILGLRKGEVVTKLVD